MQLPDLSQVMVQSLLASSLVEGSEEREGREERSVSRPEVERRNWRYSLPGKEELQLDLKFRDI